jgi:predicted amidohydrolase YtcJ
LTARVRIAHEFIRQNAHAESYLKRLGNLSGFGDPMMKIIGTTIQPADGTSNAGAIWTKEAKKREMPDSPFGPHGQNKFQNYGNTLETSEYHNIVLANRYGWNVLAVHSQGDGASDMLLQAYEQASKERPLKGVWAFDHALSRTPENIEKASKLGVLFSVAPKYLFMDTPEDLVYQFGESVHKMTPVREMIKAGMKPVMEADITGKYSAPLWNMEALITRTDEKGRVWGGAQQVTRQEALWMKTNWASYYTGDEKVLGTIQKGKLADLVVLGGDYMAVPGDQISEIPIDLTVVGGAVVYDREKDGEIKSEYWDRVRMGEGG